MFHGYDYILKSQAWEPVDFGSYMYISETKIKKKHLYFKYFEDQDCYNLTKKEAVATKDPESTIKLSTVIYPASSLSKKLDL